jgi:hypothetical protein
MSAEKAKSANTAASAKPAASKNSEDIEAHVLRKYEIFQKLGKGVSECSPSSS